MEVSTAGRQEFSVWMVVPSAGVESVQHDLDAVVPGPEVGEDRVVEWTAVHPVSLPQLNLSSQSEFEKTRTALKAQASTWPNNKRQARTISQWCTIGDDWGVATSPFFFFFFLFNFISESWRQSSGLLLRGRGSLGDCYTEALLSPGDHPSERRMGARGDINSHERRPANQGEGAGRACTRACFFSVRSQGESSKNRLEKGYVMAWEWYQKLSF